MIKRWNQCEEIAVKLFINNLDDKTIEVTKEIKSDLNLSNTDLTPHTLSELMGELGYVQDEIAFGHNGLNVTLINDNAKSESTKELHIMRQGTPHALKLTCENYDKEQ